MSNSFALLTEELTEKPVERALVIGDCILSHMKLAMSLGIPAGLNGKLINDQ